MTRSKGTHPGNDLLSQTGLMAGELAEFKDEIVEARSGGLEKLDEDILMWRVLYGPVMRKLKEGRRWLVVRHEDLVENTVGEFRVMYERLGLSFDENVKQRLLENGGESTRDWRLAVSEGEIQRVRAATRDIATYFYRD